MNHGRHYSLATLDSFWNAGNPILLPVSGSPPCELDLDPSRAVITLRTPYDQSAPDVMMWRNIDFIVKGDRSAEVSVRVSDNTHAAYGLLTEIVDLVQLEGNPLAVAVRRAIEKHRQLLLAESRMSRESEIGLFGELLVVEHLIEHMGPAAALESWQGPHYEEHDFVLEQVHLEVKSTSSEQRRHVMHGFTQLLPTPGTPLVLLSVQLTVATQETGDTLPTLISRIRSSIGMHIDELDKRLQMVDWSDNEAELFTTFWTKRTEIRAFLVDDRFPALTLDRLSQVIPHTESVSELVYRVDLTHFNHIQLHAPLTDLVEAPKETQ